MDMRSLIGLLEAASQGGQWTGTARCWFNARTSAVIDLGPRLHPDHVETFGDRGPPVSHADILRAFPHADLSDYPDPVDLYRWWFETGGQEDYPDLAEELRMLPCLVGWVSVNCDPRITSHPYVVAASRQEAQRCLRWLKRRGVHPWEDPAFVVEVFSYEGGEYRGVTTYRCDENGRLI